MADTTALKNRIRAAIKANDNQEITGPILQQTLLDIVDELDLYPELQEAINTEKNARQSEDTQLSNLITGIKNNIDNGYVYAGIATPSTVPVSGKVFYIAVAAGTYANFGGQVLTQGINILRYNGSAWSNQQLIGIDDAPNAGSKNLVESGGVDADIKLKEFELYGVYPIDGQPALVVGQGFRYNTLYDYKGTATIAITSANTDLTGFAINIMFRDKNDTEVQTRSNVKINQDARTITVNSGTKLVSLERGAGAIVNAGNLNIQITKVDSYDSRIHADINTVAGQKATFGSGETVNSTNIATDIENDNNGIAVSKDVYDAVYNETHIVDGFTMNENAQTSEDAFSKVLPNIINGHTYRISLSGSSTLGTGLNLNGYTNGTGDVIHLISFGSTYDFTASAYDEYTLERGAGTLSEGNVNIQIKELESQNFSSLEDFRDNIYNDPLAVAGCCGIVSYQHLFKFNWDILIDGNVGDDFDITNPTTISYSPVYKCAIVPVSEGDVFKIKVLGGSRAVPYALISSDNKIALKGSPLNFDDYVTIGENVSYMIVNDKSDGRIGYVYKVSNGIKFNIANQIKRLELVAPIVTTNGAYSSILRVTKGEMSGDARTIQVTVPQRLILLGGYNYDHTTIDYQSVQIIDVPHGNYLVLNLLSYELEVVAASSYYNFTKHYVELVGNNGGVAFGQWAKYQERETELYYAESGFNTIEFSNRQGQIVGFPENSLAGCAEAKKCGFNKVRVSVQYTSDGIPVLYHDQYLGTSGKVYDSNGDVVPDSDTTKISDLTYTQLQSYDFGLYAGEKWRGTKICKLEDMLLQCKRLGQSIVLEIKENVTPLTSTNIETTYNLVAYNCMVDYTTVHAYEVTTLQAFKALNQRLGLSHVKRVENVTTDYLESMSALNTGKNKVFIGFYRDSMVNMTDALCKTIHDYDILIGTAGKTADELYANCKYVDTLEYQGNVNPAKLLVKKYFNQN